MNSKPGVLEPLRVRIRRFQFIVGLGFLSLVMGSVLSVSLTMRLHTRVQALPVGLMRLLVAVVLENLWVLAVLPVLCYGAARVLDLKPWNTAVGAAMSGALFVIALDFARDGVDGLWLGGLASVLRVVAFVGGVVLSARAVVKGRASAGEQSKKAQAKAQDRKSEYDEFLKAAEQGGARLEQREAQAVASVSAPAEAPVAEAAVPASAEVTSLPVEPPASQPASESSPAPASDVPKTPAA